MIRKRNELHILFVHPNYPAQFGHIARHLVDRYGYRCSFATQKPPDGDTGIEIIPYATRGGATTRTHYWSRTFENQMHQSEALYRALKDRPDVQPDLIVAHSGFVSALFLKELYDCPIVNYFEYFYHVENSDLDFRHDLPPCSDMDRARARARNAMLMLDLENCTAGYSPTHWQTALFPERYRDKIEVIFDGIDVSVWTRDRQPPQRVGSFELPAGKKVVTYVSRGMESMRGFDIFMRVAAEICRRRDDVVFAVVGEDRIAYGGDGRFTGDLTFKQWVLKNGEYDLERIRFLGRLSTSDLAGLLSASSLHVYLTAPFVLSWSLLNALSCGCVVLASDTAPVREVIEHERNGLLTDFFDVEAWVRHIERVLDDPRAFVPLGEAGTALVRSKYSLEISLARMVEFYERLARRC